MFFSAYKSDIFDLVLVLSPIFGFILDLVISLLAILYFISDTSFAHFEPIALSTHKSHIFNQVRIWLCVYS